MFRNALKSHFHEIHFLPDLPELTEANKVLKTFTDRISRYCISHFICDILILLIFANSLHGKFIILTETFTDAPEMAYPMNILGNKKSSSDDFAKWWTCIEIKTQRSRNNERSTIMGIMVFSLPFSYKLNSPFDFCYNVVL